MASDAVRPAEAEVEVVSGATTRLTATVTVTTDDPLGGYALGNWMLS